jgi:hypothetical protein
MPLWLYHKHSRRSPLLRYQTVFSCHHGPLSHLYLVLVPFLSLSLILGRMLVLFPQVMLRLLSSTVYQLYLLFLFY